MFHLLTAGSPNQVNIDAKMREEAVLKIERLEIGFKTFEKAQSESNYSFNWANFD